MKKLPLAALGFLVTGIIGCDPGPDMNPVTRRTGAALVEGCTLDGTEQAMLADSQTQSVLQEIVLRCLSLREDGSITPTDAGSRSALGQLVSNLRGQGYRVSLAVTAHRDDGVDYDPDTLLGILQDNTLRGHATTEITALAATADAIDLALPPLPDTGRATLTQWVSELSTALRPKTRLGLFAPPQSQDASDVPGGGAVDLTAMASSLDLIRLMTLDYSSDQMSGPTTDPDWITNVVKFALSRGPASGQTAFALPLYGVDFSARGQHGVSFAEAVGLAGIYGQQIDRDDDHYGALHIGWDEADGTPHNTWFDDATSIIAYHQQIDLSLSGQIGVLYYGLGSGDPALFSSLAQAELR